MKHCTWLSILLSLALALALATASFAIFPGLPPGIGLGDGTTQIELLHGWWSPVAVPLGALPTPAWYSCFATNNIRTAQTQGLTLSYKLTNTPFIATPFMYVVTNVNNNGPVFSASPHPLGAPTYTGLWRVIYVTWLPSAVPHVITNVFPAGPGNPSGMPSVGEAIYSTSIGGAPLTPVAGQFPPLNVLPPLTIVDCPIFAVGNISSPWFKPTSLTPPYIYRIRQGRYLSGHTLTIPYWKVYCRDDITGAIGVRRVIIPDVSEAPLASLIGANLGTRLAFVGWNFPQPSPRDGKSTMYVINWRQVIDLQGRLLKVLANQYPVLDACPTSCDWRNVNRNYSPVDAFVLLNRGPAISPEVLFNNWPFVISQISANNLLPVPPYVYPPITPGPAVNAPVLCSLGG